jgi:phosphoribosylglycinamide formyltransferase 1
VLNIAVFASGRGSNFSALLNSLRCDPVDAQIVLLVSNNSHSGAMELARSAGIPAVHLSAKSFQSPAELVRATLEVLHQHRIGLIVLAGYMKKIHPEIVAAYRGRIINIHPALLPLYGGPGMYGRHVHEAVIAAKEKFSGATVHFVDEEFDHGSILRQEKIAVMDDDTPDTLAQRVLVIEHKILPEAVRSIAAQAHLHNQG